GRLCSRLQFYIEQLRASCLDANDALGGWRVRAYEAQSMLARWHVEARERRGTHVAPIDEDVGPRLCVDVDPTHARTRRGLKRGFRRRRGGGGRRSRGGRSGR